MSSPRGDGVAVFDDPLVAAVPLRHVLAVEEHDGVARRPAHRAGIDDLRLRPDDAADPFICVYRQCEQSHNDRPANRGGSRPATVQQGKPTCSLDSHKCRFLIFGGMVYYGPSRKPTTIIAPRSRQRIPPSSHHSLTRGDPWILFPTTWQQRKPVPQTNRVPWYLSSAQTYAGVMLWFVFWQVIAVGKGIDKDFGQYSAFAGGVLSHGILLALAGVVVAALICHFCFYLVPGLLGFKSGLPLYVVGTSTYGAYGGFLMPGFLMGLLQFGWLGVSSYFLRHALMRAFRLWSRLLPPCRRGNRLGDCRRGSGTERHPLCRRREYVRSHRPLDRFGDPGFRNSGRIGKFRSPSGD